MEEYRIFRDILCVDLRGFYASVECAARGLDPYETALIVADESRGKGSIVLAVSPFLKAQGLPGRFRLYELPKIDNLIIARPRMRKYLEVAQAVNKIYLSYVAPEDLHIYSVDEAFLDFTAYKSYYQEDIFSLAGRIIRDIRDKTGVPAAAGIGKNLLLAKLALDLKAKKSDSGLAMMDYDDVEKDLWPLSPLAKMWGIGPGMERRLNALGLFTVGDIARYDKKKLKRFFGVKGSELFFHAHGIDQSMISEPIDHSRSPIKSVGLGQTLFRDYTAPDIFTLILEMTDDTAERLRFLQKEAKTIHLSVSYSKAAPGGFSRQLTLDAPTDSAEDIRRACLTLFERHYDDAPVRKIAIRAGNLSKKRPFTQLSFFQDHVRKEREKRLMETLDSVRKRFGKAAVLRLSSCFDAGTAKRRANLVGGHRE